MESEKPAQVENPAACTSLLEIIYYTDPLCCWSWAMEPQWNKFRFQFNGSIRYRYCMGGLLPGWKNYYDAENAVSKPVQMGPVWMHARQVSGMPLRDDTWMTNPPASSYPACIAVKAAGLQSQKAEEIYLRLVREAIMLHGKNISDKKVLTETAVRTKKFVPGFDVASFTEDLHNDRGLDAFRSDLQEAKYHQINRFPSIVLKGERAVMLPGYRPFAVMLDAVKKTGFKLIDNNADPESYKAFWPFATKREMEEIAL